MLFYFILFYPVVQRRASWGGDVIVWRLMCVWRGTSPPTRRRSRTTWRRWGTWWSSHEQQMLQTDSMAGQKCAEGFAETLDLFPQMSQVVWHIKHLSAAYVAPPPTTTPTTTNDVAALTTLCFPCALCIFKTSLTNSLAWKAKSLERSWLHLSARRSAWFSSAPFMLERRCCGSEGNIAGLKRLQATRL